MNMNGTGTKATRRRIWLDVIRFYPYGETLTLFPGKYAHFRNRQQRRNTPKQPDFVDNCGQFAVLCTIVDNSGLVISAPASPEEAI